MKLSFSKKKFISLLYRSLENGKTYSNLVTGGAGEQGADVRRIGQYVRNWYRWVRAGVELGVNKLNADSFFCLPSMSILTLL